MKLQKHAIKGVQQISCGAILVMIMKGETKTVELGRGDYITFDLPVDAALLNTCKEGLSMLATAPGKYSSKAPLIGLNAEKEIGITPALITLGNIIPDSYFQNPLQSRFEEGPFYIASVQWHPADSTTASAFQPMESGRNNALPIAIVCFKLYCNLWGV